MPGDADAREAEEIIAAEFSVDAGAVIPVVARTTGDADATRAAVDDYARTLARLDGVARVDAVTGTYLGERAVGSRSRVGSSRIEPGPAGRPLRRRQGDLAGRHPQRGAGLGRGRAAGQGHPGPRRPTSADVAVTGPSAALVDTKAVDRQPPALRPRRGWPSPPSPCCSSCLGSVLVAAKAVVLNFLSLTATFGVIVWIFQDGHLAGLLDFTPTGHPRARTA